ncbi:amylosucrase [Truepera radiovictrix]|uniref:Alpha amylase catalytic region n=1 Tax=Truepera radiovictrix (strain DSM 17093 / CIP 108686 / LMG 22925 / RQ-24) TaxID=649638 RepID=D7CVD0_TRURR|nr:amylosucrase [Truepera radiovictrix]ADI14158.1 alpha amylase catalytic region [Truepera radiovictrix DSM 17093]WMT57280.1 amylosucrase [Truepera radiovictrix]
MQNLRLLSPEARAHVERLWPLAEAILAPADRQLFQLRLVRQFENLYEALVPLYGARDDFAELLGRLVQLLARAYAARPEKLKALDLERDLTPDWFQREGVVGYVAYAERFAGTLKGVEAHLDYLKELRVTYLHLMSVIKTREGENDGGYAVADYLDVQPQLGTLEDLERLCARLRSEGISLCLDFVLNHCADTHPWAERARAGDPFYRDFFYVFPDRTLPDAFERTLPEVFPDFAPGNFSFVPELGWVWTTFHRYQWDLNYTNPEVFLAITDTLLQLANKGVEVFRLDAVAFMWKRLGTDCQNQPEVHEILQALRACSRIAASATLHKAEAIVSPQQLIRYFGTGKGFGKASNLAYHNSLMVQFWSALASRDTRLMTYVLKNFPRIPPTTAWATYIRCHDDIGWAVTDEDAAAVGLDGHLHRAFLSDFYAGHFPGSFAVGEVFQFNPETQDRRISGTFASLAGLERALEQGDPDEIALSLERILLGYALMLGFGGTPLLYMGDELGLLNDYSYTQHPETAGDNRWLHRPYMDWAKAARRREAGSLEARLFGGVQHLIGVRARTPQLHAAYQAEIAETYHPHLFAYARPHPLGTLLCVYNFSERPQEADVGLLSAHGLDAPYDLITGARVATGPLPLPPYGRRWLVQTPPA